VSSSSKTAIQILLENGAEDIPNKKGETARTLAKTDYSDIYDLLKQWI